MAKRIRVQVSGTNTAVISQSTFKAHRSPTSRARHYHAGGNFHGIPVAPGYYEQPFWGWPVIGEVTSYNESCPSDITFSETSATQSGSGSGGSQVSAGETEVRHSCGGGNASCSSGGSSCGSSCGS